VRILLLEKLSRDPAHLKKNQRFALIFFQKHMEVLLQIEEKLRRNQLEYNELIERRTHEINSICQAYRAQFPKVFGIGKLDEPGIIYELGLFARRGDAEKEGLQFASDKFCVKQVDSGPIVNGWLIKLQK